MPIHISYLSPGRSKSFFFLRILSETPTDGVDGSDGVLKSLSSVECYYTHPHLKYISILRSVLALVLFLNVEVNLKIKKL